MKNLILIKIGESKYINDMYENEYLYFKSLKEFRSNSEDQTGRLDPKELNVSNTQINNLTLTTNNKEIELHKVFKNFEGQLMKNLDNPEINCCSLNWLVLETGKKSRFFEKKLLEMGNKALLILDWKKFFEILDREIEKMNYNFSRKKVTYYSPKIHNGEISLHHKDEKFEYQNEYRILISPTKNEPINIPLPGLKEISTVIDSSNLNKLIIK
ncbi:MULTISPECIES: hypothetical protein [unclassified Polaribacter]|uniref:hypothetical protein n=1 Tax=unclassified Polaribacter TaxID=196858 RepID=UPI001C4EA4DA|nr:MULTISPECIES: hypothetical protein [unclassified Polaribacter]QXP64854.1 hypothetical protein H0I27_06685 [Polaribacter sp. HaHaR_3_91]QXP68521.1 hypothetical protein H0I28_08565 [Polaribacter sp. AHE13PA]QXP69503.1 hypothetical protein H0I29_12845 [Polaribacter sp. R2A056_3_33]